MKGKKKAILTAGVILAALGCLLLAVYLCMGQYGAGRSRNLARRKGVIATCDSVEKESLSAAMAVDGDDQTLTSRWSSENNWEDASHYIQLEFPEEISVSFVVLKWERRNVISYALESSLDGETWEILQRFDTAPAAKQQEIVLDEAVQARFLRLSTYAVSKEEADYSNLYQNVSLYEFEVYGDKPTAYKLETPVIEKTAAGERKLVLPETPDGFRVTLIGADLEQVIGADGTVYDTIQGKDVTVGYLVEDTRGREETREVSFVVHVPAADAVSEEVQSDAGGADADKALAEDGQGPVNACPGWVIPSIAEWRGGRGSFYLEEGARIIVDRDSRPSGKEEKTDPAGGQNVKTGESAESDAQTLWDVAELLSGRCGKDRDFRKRLPVIEGTEEDVGPGDIYLGYAQEENGLGREGYTCEITDKCVIKAETATGIRWGTVTLMQMLFTDWKEGETAPQGYIRDYPLYEVRGFGIDVARKAVSLDVLYTMMETMSWYKMNDLAIHLNDNEILATSGLTGSAEQAMTAESAFRLESGVLGVQAEGDYPTPQEYAYTKEELAQFIATAKTYGVTVVPEIDTPAHSLSITKRYPDYALRTSGESVDQIDLGNGKAVALAEEIWREALDEESGAFREAEIVNIGMDEYYGDGEQYRQYLTRINRQAQEAGKTVRLWGSLSNMGGTTVPSPENLQMNIWSTDWADPREMYEAGYSLINMQNNHLYIIPGGGYDYLDCRELYENWAPNRFYDYNRTETIPAYSPQMLGAAYMIWNDMCGSLDIGISEYDLYVRFLEPLGVLSARLWGADRITSDLEKQTGRLEQLGIEELAVEPRYTVKMKVRLDENTAKSNQPQIIAEGDCAYGKWAFYAVEPETGKVGFTREGRTYTFDYTLPKGEWVNLKVEGEAGVTKLYAGGESFFPGGEKEVDSLGSSEPFEEHATFVFPLQRVGEETGSFDGELELYMGGNGGGALHADPLQ